MLAVVDAQAGGDVGRVVVGGLEAIPGASVAERARHLRAARDDLRLAFMRAPHGDRTHSINLVVPPTEGSGAEFGLIIMGTMGYPGFSGSNVMCTIAALNLVNRLPVPAQRQPVRIETPIGTTTLQVSRGAGEPVRVEYTAPAGRILLRNLSARTVGHRSVSYDLVDSGVPYVVVDSDAAGIDPRTATAGLLRDLFDPLLAHASGRLRDDTGRARPVTLGLLAEPATPLPPSDAGGTAERNVAVYMAGGVLCAGPTGTGTTALLTWLQDRQRIVPGTSVRAVSPAGNAFGATLLHTSESSVGIQVHTTITGEPLVLGRGDVPVAV